MWFTAGTLHFILMAQAIAGGSDRYGQLKNIDQAFHDFMTRYNKKYETDEQYQIAKAAFAGNMREIEELRANDDITHEVGLNEHADLPPEVFDRVFQCAGDPQSRGNLRSANATDSQDLIMDLPPSIDWEAAGALAPVRNQKACGSCYAMGAIAVMESRFKIQTGITKVVPFSVQQIVDSAAIEAHPSGSYLYAEHDGIVRERSYPYKAKVGNCKKSITTDPKKQCLRPYDIHSFSVVPEADEALMMQAVATGPVAVRLYGRAPSFRHYTGGIITTKSCGVAPVSHTVTIVGYNTSSKGVRYWKILNSWGKNWGVRGFAYIERTGNEPGPNALLQNLFSNMPGADLALQASWQDNKILVHPELAFVPTQKAVAGEAAVGAAKDSLYIQMNA
ncbi:cathepsin L, putative [Perkinsus marinus ATCC 50983]|uniref:Cathepsin L, putative n=1 Tax=Perkinsus marinus (strain ATCC 50983 / TXsc) TaxID=423536 RepID=C5KMB9_PERM5|nr:cathepsin L, putative [Perkinsus marinus ATCC 50983]EER14373.1 cathepsin L, putative [Perkinsus marinus ATCC 50983]|eukprot:XP_002782578.1 cathepsin L, putative [Perkinsus marinus ATCC 50983]